LIHVKIFTAGSLLPLEFFAIPGGAANLIPVTLFIRIRLGPIHFAAREHGRLWVVRGGYVCLQSEEAQHGSEDNSGIGR
jgi:hypothetical protein